MKIKYIHRIKPTLTIFEEPTFNTLAFVMWYVTYSKPGAFHEVTIGFYLDTATYKDIIGTLSHESIELELTKIEASDNIHINIHKVIGNLFVKDNPLTVEDFVGNADGLPNLPENKFKKWRENE